MVRHYSVSVEIHLSGYLTSLAIRDKVASALHQASNFILRNHTITVLVTDAEGLIGVEVRISLQGLSCSFFRAFSADHGPHHILERLCSRVGKDVVLA